MTTTSIENSPENKLSPSPREKLERSYTRSNKLSNARGRNKQYAAQIDEFVNDVVIDDENVLKFLNKFSRNIKGCSCKALYRKLNDGRQSTLIGSLTCDHRTCTVCNMLRAKKIRRKFMSFLTSEAWNVPIKNGEKHFFIENFENISHVSGSQIVANMDFMHLTLTVPHTNTGWNGKKFYAKELLQLFNKMRKCDWYKSMVFGGTQTVEVEKKTNGLHIHIHSMIAVKKMQGSRNFLSRKILEKWNELTIDFTRPNEGFTTERIDGLRDGYKSLSPKDFGEMCDTLDSRGSTFIGLKSLFYPTSRNDFYKHRKVDRFIKNNKHYVYCNSGNPESMLRGAMECLKYHFEPCVLEDEDGKLDIDLLCQLIPNIYRQRLYARSGAFTRVAELKLSDTEKTNDTADLMDDLKETAQDQAFDPETGQPVERDNYHYIIADPEDIRYNPNKIHYHLKYKGKFFRIPPESSPNLKEAMIAFTFYARESNKDRKRPEIAEYDMAL